MSLLEIYIGKSKYTLDCEEHERTKITNLASRLNERVNRLYLKMRGADEKTILMLCSIMIEEELESVKNFKTTQQSNNSEPKEANKQHDNVNINPEDVDAFMSKNIENISLYIEDLANKIKNY